VAVEDTTSKIFDEKESTKRGLKIPRPVTRIMIRSEEGGITGIKPVLVSLLISKVSLTPINLTGMLRPMHRKVHLVEDTEGISGLMVSEVGPTMFLLGIVVSIRREQDTTAIKGLKTTTDRKEAETPTLKNMESVQIAALRNVGFNMLVEGFK
jgi:hypothetical protein